MDTKVADNLIGTVIDGRYRVRGRVARGGMATVYTATDERLERTVALKMIHPGQADDPRFVDRFTREAKTIARLTHPNVVAVYDQGSYRGLPYLVMEYVRGRTLRDLLSDTRRLSATEALAVLEQMLAAIAAAHRAGVVHRDIKPENVLIAEAPGSPLLIDAVVKVADFGLAKAVEASAEDGDGQLLATVAYVAPELVTDGRSDPRSDVYSVGIVLFEMLTGRVPYDGGKPVEVAWRHVDEDVPAPSKFVPTVPVELDRLVARATNRNPDRRPTDAGALLGEVQAIRDAVESGEALRSRTLAAPTIPVEALPRTARPTDRPAWSRLPATTAEPTAIRRRASVTGTRAAARRSAAADATDSPLQRLTVWFSQVMQRPNGRRTFYATLAVLAVIVAVTGYWFGFGRYTSAPKLTGQTQAAAVASAHKLGFHLRFNSPVWSDSVPKGTVSAQSPAAGGRVVKGGMLTLTVSNGKEQYPVPNEQGKQYSIVVQDLQHIKASASRIDQYDNDLPSGYVLKTDPPAGQIVFPGAIIKVYVSKGKAPITVPNVVGQDVNAATQTLTGLGLTVATTSKSSTTVPPNQVMAQSPDEGAGVTKGTQVTLTVSTGPPMVQVPDVTNQGLSFDQAAQQLKKFGLVAVDMFDFPSGQVRNQNPAPGTTVQQGSQVQLWMGP